MAQTFGSPEWGSLDWGSQQGKIVHDISPTFSTVTGLDAIAGRYRGVVDKKENEWGKPEWASLAWAGRGDRITSRTGQKLDVDLGRYRSVSASQSTTSTLEAEAVRFRNLSLTLSTTSGLSAVAFVYGNLKPNLATDTNLEVALKRLRRPVTDKTNEWGRPEWGEIVWAGTGDKIVSRTGQSLAVALKRIRSVSADLVTQSGLDSQVIRIRAASANFVTTSELTALLRGAERGLLDYQGSLAPGETLEMDNLDLLLTKGGNNDRKNANIEDWIDLQPGKNVLVYNDSEAGRSIEIEIIKEDRTI